MAVGRDHHSDGLPAADGAGGVCGDEASEAAARRPGGRQQDQAWLDGVRRRAAAQGPRLAGRASGAEGEKQQRKREDQPEEEEESEGIGKKEEEGASGGGC